MMSEWQPIETCPEGVEVMTKIDDHYGGRNEQMLVRFGRMFFVDTRKSAYVYYAPTHWAPTGDTK
jgi:hypothetical protein